MSGRLDVTIVTGMSGAGRSEAAHVLEDLGYFVIDNLPPTLIGKVAGDSDAYEYLPASVKRFPGPEGLAAAMERAGLGNIRWILTAGGIIALHVGERPA